MSAPQPTAVAEASGRVALTHPDGLHARPSVKLTKLAKTFAAGIEFAPADVGPWTDAKSIVRVMAAKLSRGSVLHFRAAGPDAQAAVDALVALVARDFDDGGADDDDSA